MFIAYQQLDFTSRTASEEQICFVAEPKVLRSLPDIEGEFCLPATHVTAVELHDAIFERQAAQRWLQRLAIETLQIEPAVGGRSHRHSRRTVMIMHIGRRLI